MRKAFYVFLVAFLPLAAHGRCGCEATTLEQCSEPTLATVPVQAPVDAPISDASIDFSLCADCGEGEWAGAIVFALILLPFVAAVHRAIKRRNPLLVPRFSALSGTSTVPVESKHVFRRNACFENSPSRLLSLRLCSSR